LGGNEVKTTTELGITTISSDPFKVPIFSLALDRMQDDIPTIWKKPINKLNTCTTVDTNSQENFSY
jgi:hypothetical protein